MEVISEEILETEMLNGRADLSYLDPPVRTRELWSHRTTMTRKCRILEQLLKGIKDLDILDLGCGWGTQAAFMASLGHNVCGADQAQIMKEFTRRKLRKFHVQAVVHDIDADDLCASFGAEAFDVIILFDVIEHIWFQHKTPSQLMAELHAVLKKGGRLFIIIPNVAYWRNRVRLLMGWNVFNNPDESYLRTSKRYRTPHIHEFTKDEVEQLFDERWQYSIRGNRLLSSEFLVVARKL